MGRLLKKLLKVVAGLFLGALLLSSVLWLREEHYGPWSTGGPHRAMLGATFGMSVPEVERATKQRLLSCYEAKHSIKDYKGETPFDFTFSCDGRYGDRERHERTSYRFIDTIELFGVPCWVELEFLDDRLQSVEAHFKPWRSEAAKAVEVVTKELESRGYKLEKREDSDSVPGGYSNNYRRPPVKAWLWVNIQQDPKYPFFTLNIQNEDGTKRLEEEKSARDKTAF